MNSPDVPEIGWNKKNKTVEEALAQVARLHQTDGLAGVLILAWDNDGYLVTCSSAMNNAEANYLVDRAKQMMLRNPEAGDG